jgi:hypothetical protein
VQLLIGKPHQGAVQPKKQLGVVWGQKHPKQSSFFVVSILPIPAALFSSRRIIPQYSLDVQVLQRRKRPSRHLANTRPIVTDHRLRKSSGNNYLQPTPAFGPVRAPSASLIKPHVTVLK